MKRIVMLVSAIVLAMPLHAQMKGMDMKAEKKDAATHKARGVVTRVDPNRSSVTIKHDPVASLNWPSMSMGFIVKDKALLEKLKKDQKVDFEFVQQGKDYVVTSVK
jgi:Cu(I)/Ag(I) efflux system protein CusF